MNAIQTFSNPSSIKCASLEQSEFSSSLLLEITRKDKVYTCSAVAITKNVLLTAAHCVDDITSARAMLDTTYCADSKNAIAIKNVQLHPGYNPKLSNFKDDIAIVFLEHNLPAAINTASIEWQLDVSDIHAIMRIGFGGRNNLNTRTLQGPTQLTFYSNKTINLKDEDAVVGDSGGPIYAKTAQGYKLLAVHSTLEGTNKTYSTYVIGYKEWIESHLPIRRAPPYKDKFFLFDNQI